MGHKEPWRYRVTVHRGSLESFGQMAALTEWCQTNLGKSENDWKVSYRYSFGDQGELAVSVVIETKKIEHHVLIMMAWNIE